MIAEPERHAGPEVTAAGVVRKRVGGALTIGGEEPSRVVVVLPRVGERLPDVRLGRMVEVTGRARSTAAGTLGPAGPEVLPDLIAGLPALIAEEVREFDAAAPAPQ